MRPPGFEPGSPAWQAPAPILWNEIRDGFREFAADRYAPQTAKGLINYLDRFIGSDPIHDPKDILRIFQGLSVGQQHHLNRALRALFNYLEILGWSKEWLDSLRKAIPKDRVGIDLHVPEPEEILESMKRLPGIPLKYRALWNLCLDSGARMIEAIRIIGAFSEEKLTAVNGFYRYDVGAFRRSKQAYYAYFTWSTFEVLHEAAGIRIKEKSASHYYCKYGLVSPKYLRKFAFDRMIELGVPESIADFIEGRVPKRIGAKHYMALRRQGDKWYPKYGEYLKVLREKAG